MCRRCAILAVRVVLCLLFHRYSAKMSWSGNKSVSFPEEDKEGITPLSLIGFK